MVFRVASGERGKQDINWVAVVEERDKWSGDAGLEIGNLLKKKNSPSNPTSSPHSVHTRNRLRDRILLSRCRRRVVAEINAWDRIVQQSLLELSLLPL